MVDSPRPAPASNAARRLESWKEIAAYLRRDVKTARRWEQREGLPVHRQQHDSIGSVYAFEDEIEQWRAGRRAPRPLPASSRPSEAPLLVGRSQQLAELHDALTRARRGTRQILFISGELGIGKTALVQAFLGSLDESVRVAEGQCVEPFGAGEPYLPVVEALTRLAGDTSIEDIVERCAPAWANTILQRRGSRDARLSPHSQVRDRSARELSAAIEALASARPLVLVLEDLHWSDHATIELIAHLARRRESVPLMLLGTYRPASVTAAESSLRTLLRELHAHFHSHELPVPSLDEDAVRAYLERQGPWRDLAGAARWLYARTEGNALFLVHVMQHLVELGHVMNRDGQWSLDEVLANRGAIVPRTLRALIDAQIGALNDESRRALEIASVAGETFAAASVADAADMDLRDVEWLLQDLAQRGDFIREREPALWPDGALSSAYRFVHEFCRTVLYERIPAGTRAALHRTIGARLDRAYGERATEIATGLAMHFERGRDPVSAIAKYRQAAEVAVARGAAHEANLCLTSALELVADLPAGGDRDALERDLRVQNDRLR